MEIDREIEQINDIIKTHNPGSWSSLSLYKKYNGRLQTKSTQAPFKVSGGIPFFSQYPQIPEGPEPLREHKPHLLNLVVPLTNNVFSNAAPSLLGDGPDPKKMDRKKITLVDASAKPRPSFKASSQNLNYFRYMPDHHDKVTRETRDGFLESTQMRHQDSDNDFLPPPHTMLRPESVLHFEEEVAVGDFPPAPTNAGVTRGEVSFGPTRTDTRAETRMDTRADTRGFPSRGLPTAGNPTVGGVTLGNVSRPNTRSGMSVTGRVRSPFQTTRPGTHASSRRSLSPSMEVPSFNESPFMRPREVYSRMRKKYNIENAGSLSHEELKYAEKLEDMREMARKSYVALRSRGGRRSALS